MANRIIPHFGGGTPGVVSQGPKAYFRVQAQVSARESMEAVIRQYAKLIKHLKSVTPDVIRNALEPVFDKSQEYVPKRTGELRDSGTLSVTGEGNFIEGSIVYGNPVAWYAALVHEYVWLNHNPPTRAKYLQAAMEEELDAFMTSIAVDYAMALR